MRRTYNGKSWIYIEGGDLAGITMGSDFCAEHEVGVKKMRSLFNLDESKDGIDRRTIRTIPKELRQVSGPAQIQTSARKKKEVQYGSIFLCRTESYYRQPEDWVKGELTPYEIPEDGLTTAWDEDSFGIVAWNDKSKKNLNELWNAFQRKDIAFWTNVGPFHLGGGLIFGIVSKIPKVSIQDMLVADLDYKKLLKEVEATGIEAKLKAAGKRWYALSPRWAREIHDIKTKHQVAFWLNPTEQHIHNYGWFTIEDLEQWAEDKGPIMMTKEEREKQR